MTAFFTTFIPKTIPLDHWAPCLQSNGNLNKTCKSARDHQNTVLDFTLNVYIHSLEKNACLSDTRRIITLFKNLSPDTIQRQSALHLLLKAPWHHPEAALHLLHYTNVPHTPAFSLRLYAGETYRRRNELYSHSIVSQRSIQSKGSSPPWQRSTCPYPEPDQSSPHHHILSLWDPT
jgi:hypothetical protein